MENEHYARLYEFYKYLPDEGIDERITELQTEVKRMEQSIILSRTVLLALMMEKQRRET